MRQTTRAFGLASLARRSQKRSEDAANTLAAPGARLLLSTRSSAPAPHPAPERTCCHAARTVTLQLYPTVAGGFLTAPGAPEPSWRNFSSNPVVGLPTTPQQSPGLTNADSHRRASQLQHQAQTDQPKPTSPPANSAAFSLPAGGRERGDGGGNRNVVPHGPVATLSVAQSSSPSAPPTFSTAAATGTSVAGFHSAAPGGPTYHESKDGSFAGRIVQHDGSHAVHLLVSGTGSRDYNLRMVRCHARDELHFGGGAGAACGVHPGGAGGGGAAMVRSEDVPFSTFLYRQVRDTVSATFLPAGYPDTTGQNYVRFMCWQGVNNIAVTANSVLASTFMLYAVGLGAGSIPTAGALNWVLKDGMGQLGTLLFGKTIAHNFDVHSKTWFFLSAVMLQAAAALELLTVLAPQHFLLMGSLANTLKGLAWMAAGSTRSVFHLSFARDNNIADVTAKGTSQYIFASLVGTAGGAFMCAAVGQSGPTAATCFGLLSAAAVGSAYMAVQAIPLTTLNATRLQLLVDAFLDSISPAPATGKLKGGAHESGEEDDEEEDLHTQHHHPQHDRHRDHRRMVEAAATATATITTATASVASGSASKAGWADGDGRPQRMVAVVQSSGGDFDPDRREAEEEGEDRGEGEEEDDEEEGGDDGSGVDLGVRKISSGGGGGAAAATAAASAAAAAGSVAGGAQASGGGGGGGAAAGGSRRWYRRPRAYRTVDRCYIGPSVHEYEMMYDDSLEPQVPTPLELSPLDPPLPYFSRCAERLSPRIAVGSRLEHVVDGNPNLLVMLLNTYKYAHFMVLPRRDKLHVVLHEKADPRDMVQAYLQACILRRRLRNKEVPFPDPDEQTAELRLELQESLAAAERLTTIFMSTVEAHGWTVSKIVVEAQRRRARW